LKEGNVAGPVIAEDPGRVAAARLRDDDIDRGRAADHVVVREHLARRCQHHPRPGSRAALVGEIRVDDDDTGADRRRLPVREGESLGSNIAYLHHYLLERFPFSFRVTIADNGSTDGTWELAQELEHELTDVQALRLDEKGRGRALHTVWSESDASVLVYMDVD